MEAIFFLKVLTRLF